MNDIDKALTGVIGWIDDEHVGAVCMFDITPEFREQRQLPADREYALSYGQVRQTIAVCNNTLEDEDLEYEARVAVLSELGILEEALQSYGLWVRLKQDHDTDPNSSPGVA